MKYHKLDDKDFIKFIKLINPDLFLKDMKERGIIDEITKNYGEDVYKLCMNACGWMTLKLKNTYYYYSAYVIEGSFRGRHHSWLSIGDYYIDLTLAQFTDSPRLAITKADEDNGYQPELTQNLETYVYNLTKDI